MSSEFWSYIFSKVTSIIYFLNLRVTSIPILTVKGKKNKAKQIKC